MKKVLKIVLFVFIGLFVIGLIANLSSDNNSTEAHASPTEQIPTQQPVVPVSKQWVEVTRLKGSGAKKSATFTINGDARMKYNYTSQMADMGMFAAYVVEKGVDIMKDGGVPDVMLSKSESGESYIQKSAGDYYLNVDGAGTWEVIIEEQR